MEYSNDISFSIPKLDADISSETSVPFYHTKGRETPEYSRFNLEQILSKFVHRMPEGLSALCLILSCCSTEWLYVYREVSGGQKYEYAKSYTFRVSDIRTDTVLY
jgi:hypothetical protein